VELATLAELRYIPKWRGNRDLQEGVRGSVVLVPLSGIDVLLDRSEEDMRTWRDERLKPITDAEPSMAGKLTHMDMTALRMLRVVDDHTKGWRGWTIRGVQCRDGMEIILRGFPSKGYGEADSLLVELNTALADASVLGEAELGNWIALSAGPAPTTGATPAAEGASPTDASTPRGASAP